MRPLRGEAVNADTQAEIRNCLQIIRGSAEFVKDVSTCGKAIHSASVTIASVDRIVKLLEAEHGNDNH